MKKLTGIIVFIALICFLTSPVLAKRQRNENRQARSANRAHLNLSEIDNTTTGIAEAEDFDDDKNSILKGSYLVTSNIHCVTATGRAPGFNLSPPSPPADDLTLIHAGATSSMVTQGEYIFNGDGTGSRFINWLVIVSNGLDPGQRPLNYGTSESDFDYTVNKDGTFEMTSGVVTVKKVYGGDQTISGLGTATGAIAAGQKTFTIADTYPTIETIHRNVDIERICNRTGIGIKIK